MRRIFNICLMCAFLTGCAPTIFQKATHDLTPANSIALATVRPTSMGPNSDMIITGSPTSEDLGLPPLDPIWTPTPAPKSVLIKYEQFGGDGPPSGEIETCRWIYFPYPKFILFEDGQLVFAHCCRSYQEAWLTDDEMQALLASIEDTGFLNLPGDRIAREEEIFDPPPNFEHGEGGWGRSLTVKDMEVYVPPYMEKYVVPQVKDAFEIIENYSPNGRTKPFIPSSIRIYYLDRSVNAFPENDAAPVNWPADLPPIVTGDEFMHDSMLDRASILLLLRLKVFTHFPQFITASQNGKIYDLLACPIIPPAN